MPDTDVLLRIAYDAAEAGNFEHARRCYETGAALGDAMCLQALGYMYDVGEGVAADKALAMKLYRKAWKRGEHAVATNIAVLYREIGNKRMMFRWYQRVAYAGDGSAQLEMAKCYISGTGVRKDVTAALRCLAVANASDYITEYEREEAQAMISGLNLDRLHDRFPPQSGHSALAHLRTSLAPLRSADAFSRLTRSCSGSCLRLVPRHRGSEANDEYEGQVLAADHASLDKRNCFDAGHFCHMCSSRPS